MTGQRATGLRVVGLVLAGGEARRMDGSDKSLLPLGGRPMLAWVIDALDLPNIAISANGDPARFAAFGRPVLPDGRFAGQGPLAGLLAGMDWAASVGADAVLTAPADTPFLPAGLAHHLQPPPCAAASNGRQHHLVACWPVAARVMLKSWLAGSKPRRVEAFAATLSMRYMNFGCHASDPFANVNTPGDLQAARLRAAGMNGGNVSGPSGGTRA